jgi:hypothetical protein
MRHPRRLRRKNISNGTAMRKFAEEAMFRPETDSVIICRTAEEARKFSCERLSPTLHSHLLRSLDWILERLRQLLVRFPDRATDLRPRIDCVLDERLRLMRLREENRKEAA